MRRTLAWFRWAITRLGYAVRPYDLLADRRRWRWQRRTPCPRQRIFWVPPDGGSAIDITDRVAARHVPGRCDRWCLETPAGPCAEQCVEDWMREVGRG